jgi:ribosomal protein S26
LTQATASDVGYDALMHSSLVWCKKGAIAKMSNGRLGVVTKTKDWGEEYSDYSVKLRFADGESEGGRHHSGYIIADSLTQATPSDAGYEALVQAEWYEQATQMKAKTGWCKKGVIVRTVNGGQPGVVCAMARWLVERRRRAGRKTKTDESDVRIQFADGKESKPISAELLTEAMPSDVGYDALMHSSLVWCREGAIAKTAEGRLGVVTRERLAMRWPEAGVYSVKLRFADGEGESSDYIMADSLIQATPSDAGYEALVCVRAKISECSEEESGGESEDSKSSSEE